MINQALAKRYPKIDDPLVEEIGAVRCALRQMQRAFLPDSIQYINCAIVDTNLRVAQIRFVEGGFDWASEINAALQTAVAYGLSVPGLSDLAKKGGEES